MYNKAYEAQKATEAPAAEAVVEEAKVEEKMAITGNTINAPLPGRVLSFKVKVGDSVTSGQEVAILEAMKMENSITSDFSGVVKQILVAEGDNLQSDTPMIEIVAAAEAPKAAPAAEAAPAPVAAGPKNKVTAPLPGRVLSLKVKVGDTVAVGQEVVVLEAMKMENSISTDYAGTVVEVLVAEGDNVQSDATLITVQ